MSKFNVLKIKIKKKIPMCLWRHLCKQVNEVFPTVISTAELEKRATCSDIIQVCLYEKNSQSRRMQLLAAFVITVKM